MTPRIPAAGLAAGSALLLLLSGCSLGGGSGADEAAAQLAAQLASGKFTTATVNDPDKVTEKYAALTAAMSADPEVSAGDVSTDGDSATATMHWRWPLRGGTWSYSTKVRLARHGDAWLARWQPSEVAPGLDAGDRLETQTLPARRGDILGAGGVKLVKPRPVLSFGIDKTRVKPKRAAGSARALAGLLGLDVAPYVKRVRASGPKAFVTGIVYRKGEVPSAVRSGYPDIPGAVAVPGTLPLAPTRDFAAPILGRVGQATAEIVKQSKGRVRAGDESGLSGLQARYDERLAGEPGTRVVAVPAKGDTRTLFTAEPTPGKDLRTTLVPREQRLAEKLLAEVGPASALVAIRPSDGHILAAASGPGSKGQNTATYGRYAPGSTFKTVSSLALLRSGLTPQSRVPCTSGIDVSGKHFGNDSYYPASGLGRIPLTLALANSCNTAYVSQAPRLHGEDLASAAAALGFGVDHDLGFPAYFGQAPKPQGSTEAAADMIGQGRILASPMAMATVVASVLHGKAVLPVLLPDHEVTQRQPAHPLTAKEAGELRVMMRSVVTTPTGTGHGLADVPGKPVIAKTGTAEFGDTPPLDTHAWMVGGQGDLAVAVFIDRGKTGAGTAGPVLEAFLRGQ